MFEDSLKKCIDIALSGQYKSDNVNLLGDYDVVKVNDVTMCKVPFGNIMFELLINDIPIAILLANQTYQFLTNKTYYTWDIEQYLKEHGYKESKELIKQENFL